MTTIKIVNKVKDIARKAYNMGYIRALSEEKATLIRTRADFINSINHLENQTAIEYLREGMGEKRTNNIQYLEMNTLEYKRKLCQVHETIEQINTELKA